MASKKKQEPVDVYLDGVTNLYSSSLTEEEAWSIMVKHMHIRHQGAAVNVSVEIRRGDTRLAYLAPDTRVIVAQKH